METLPTYTRVSAAMQHCPRCDTTSVTTATLTPHFVSLRCARCGEAWVILERRRLPRENARAERFPLPDLYPR